MAIQLKTEVPGPKSRALMQQRDAAVARGPFHVTPIFVARAQGAVIEDVDGNRLIDLAGGIGVMTVGHQNPAVLDAVSDQAARFLHVAFNVTPYEAYVRVCERLNGRFAMLHPQGAATKSFLANSGAEAVENAIKIARVHTQRQAVVCFDHAFHGRTYLAMTLTSKYKPYKYGFAPFNPEVYRVPFPYCYRWPTTSDPATVSQECFHEFVNLTEAQLSPSQVAAVIFEPVTGEGGFIPMLPEFLKKLRAYCSEHKIVLIADEIQSGFGRTGKFFACEHLGVAPDLLVTAKALGGGLPISAVTGRAEVMDAPIVGAIGGTFGGNPLACASALAVFDFLEKTPILEHAQELAVHLQKTFARWQGQFELIGDVRGLGPMQGLELVKSRKSKEPHADAAKALAKFALERGVIIMSSGTHGNVIRFLPPLTITLDELTEGLAVLEQGFRSIS